MIKDSQSLNIRALYKEFEDGVTLDKILSILPSEELKEYTLLCLDHAQYEPTREDMLLLEIMCDFGLLRGQINAMPIVNGVQYIPTNILATQLVAGILRNTYKHLEEEHPVQAIYAPREELYDLGKNPDNFKSGRALNDQTLQQIFQCIEAQKGPLTPVEGSAPIQRSPQEDFATCIFITENMSRWNK